MMWEQKAKELFLFKKDSLATNSKHCLLFSINLFKI